MRTVTIIVDGQVYSGTPDLGTSLSEFLTGQGRQTEEILFSEDGKPVSTQFTLVHSVTGKVLTAEGVVSEVVPALTLDEVAEMAV